MKYVKIFVLLTIVAFLLIGLYFYKPPIKNITTSELDAIYGIKNGGVIMNDIQTYLIVNPNAKVEDLRQIKGVDDMIIDQLKERFR